MYRHLKVELIAKYDYGFLITLYAHLMSHTLYTFKFYFLPSIILIISGGRCNYEAIHYAVFPNILILPAIKSKD
jgi:hypothetical protein